MPIFPVHPARLHPYFGYRSATDLRLMARALRARRPGFEPTGRWGAARTLLSQYFSHEVTGLPVTLEIEAGGRHHCFETVTDGEGFARFDLTLPEIWPLPAHAAWDVASLSWNGAHGRERVDAHILAPGADNRLAVISDIDDTIIETGVTGGLRSVARNWKRLFASLPGDRDSVPGANLFYGALGGGTVPAAGNDERDNHLGDRFPATRRPFFYVSSSPWNLFAYLVAFKQAKGIPLGPMMLRDWGLNRDTFGSGSHGSHKVEAIKQILATYPDTRFALVGDDTQGDVTAFAGIAAETPHMIAAIFIRKAAAEDFSPEEAAARATIDGLGIPLWIGPSYDIGQEFLRELGFTPGGETETLIEAVEEEAAAANAVT